MHLEGFYQMNTTIPDKDTPTACSRCGEVYQKRYMTGIGSDTRVGPGSLRQPWWLCGNCVLNGGADEAFSRIRRQINAAIQAEQEGRPR